MPVDWGVGGEESVKVRVCGCGIASGELVEVRV